MTDFLENVKIYDPKSSEEKPEDFLCSLCFQPAPLKELHVQPYWNDTVNAFLTSYRCSKCWQPSLEDTRTRLRKPTREVREAFIHFLEFHHQNALVSAYQSATKEREVQLVNDFLADVELNPDVFFVGGAAIADFFLPHS